MWTAFTLAASLFFSKYKSHLIIAGIALVVVLGVCGFAFFDIKHKEQLAADLAVQKFQIEQLKLQAQMIQKDQAAIIANSQEMIKNLTQIRTDVAENQRKITKYDLDKIAAKHPRILEDHINKATQGAFGRLQELSKP
ncbi:MAG: hypothetical protein EOO77_29640 [Oxalobacteraceae bacterium]|nr:MAG: hypothetical protein EOO77_29640 [Oxalobacteraceae bacterium]